jgi:transcriptional regulator with XRE-family HTH domain
MSRVGKRIQDARVRTGVSAKQLAKKLGVSETKAYESYGRRIGLLPYIRFCSLVTQNLKKGNRGFTELLKQEAKIAFEERKEIAKRLGEEAGTKLLMPMMLMLIIVFMIILIPAFISFRV